LIYEPFAWVWYKHEKMAYKKEGKTSSRTRTIGGRAGIQEGRLGMVRRKGEFRILECLSLSFRHNSWREEKPSLNGENELAMEAPGLCSTLREAMQDRLPACRFAHCALPLSCRQESACGRESIAQCCKSTQAGSLYLKFGPLKLQAGSVESTGQEKIAQGLP
jgi:hypothetical protein